MEWHLISLTRRTYLSLSCDSNLNWIPVFHLKKNLRGELEKVRTMKILFRSAVCSRVTQGTRASVSHLTELCGSTLKQAPVCLVCSAKRDEKQSLAICSHFRWSLGFLKSRPEQWNSALPYQKSFLAAASSHLLVYCSIVQPSPPLHLSVYLPCALLLILCCWLSFSLCGAFHLFYSFVLRKPRSSCIPADASLLQGGVKSRVTGDRPRLSFIWHRCTGVIKVAERRRCRLQPDLCLFKTTLEWIFLFAGRRYLNKSHVVTDHLSSSESQQGRSQSKYMMNRQPDQCDWYSLFCLGAIFGLLTSLIISECDCTVLGQVPERSKIRITDSNKYDEEVCAKPDPWGWCEYIQRRRKRCSRWRM